MRDESSQAATGRVLIRGIDTLNAWMGRLVAWLTLLMVVLGAYNAIARWAGRYIGLNLSSNAYIELQWYLFSLIFLLGAANTLRRNGHVRVDVIYGRLSRRTQAIVDLVGTLVFLIPFGIFILWVSWPTVQNSWAVLEGSPDPGGLPRYPLKTVILVSFGLLLLQAVSQALKRLAELRGRGSLADDGEVVGTDVPDRPREML